MRSLISALTGLALLTSPLLATAAENPAPAPATASAKSDAKPAAKKPHKKIHKTKEPAAKPQGRKGKIHGTRGGSKSVKTPAVTK